MEAGKEALEYKAITYATNEGVPHGLRDKPAWEYAAMDYKRGWKDCEEHWRLKERKDPVDFWRSKYYDKCQDLNKAEQAIEKLTIENRSLNGLLVKGLKFMKEAKRLFAPNTTNSLADEWIEVVDEKLFPKENR